jgi:hypothetical protein
MLLTADMGDKTKEAESQNGLGRTRSRCEHCSRGEPTVFGIAGIGSRDTIPVVSGCSEQGRDFATSGPITLLGSIPSQEVIKRDAQGHQRDTSLIVRSTWAMVLLPQSRATIGVRAITSK